MFVLIPLVVYYFHVTNTDSSLIVLLKETVFELIEVLMAIYIMKNISVLGINIIDRPGVAGAVLQTPP